jgi:hypothetical protein
MQLFKSLKIYKEYQKIQLQLRTGILYLAIVAGIILNNGCENKKSGLKELPMIEKPCLNDMLFVQSQINFDDTLTINDFYISDSFFTRNSKHFEIIINEDFNKLMKIKFPQLTTCIGVNKFIGKGSPYYSSNVPPNCNFFFSIKNDSTIMFSDSLKTIFCIKREPKMIYFPQMEK